MNLLILTSTPRQPDNRALWESLQGFVSADIVSIPKQEQRNLSKYLNKIDLKKYDRIIVDLLFRYISRQADLLSRISNLVIYEEDACQEFILRSRWFGRFSKFYKKLPNARVVLTGHRITESFRAMGFDAHFLPKGFNQKIIYRSEGTRDIPLAFVGRTASSAYAERKEFLDRAALNLGAKILRTQPGEDYRNTLNRIQLFLSADIGLNEYMAKNFEAMACGCLLIAFRQGHGEEEALGLIDGKHLALYDSFEECSHKIEALLSKPELIREISSAGMEHVQTNFSYDTIAHELYEKIILPHRSNPVTNYSIVNFIKFHGNRFINIFRSN